MSVQNDKEIPKSIMDDFEILPEDHMDYDLAFKILIVGNESN